MNGEILIWGKSRKNNQTVRRQKSRLCRDYVITKPREERDSRQRYTWNMYWHKSQVLHGMSKKWSLRGIISSLTEGRDMGQTGVGMGVSGKCENGDRLLLSGLGENGTLWCTRLCVTWLVNVPQLCLFLLTVFDTLAHEVWFYTMFYANVNPRTYVHYEHRFFFPVKAMSIVEKVKMDY